ncbi:MAG TPA: TadE family protein, partial [Bryobacteraceae bacterium]
MRGNAARGSVMVELSLVATAFLVLLIGILDLGQFLFLQQAVVERARYAARWGALNDPTNSTAIQNMVLYL